MNIKPLYNLFENPLKPTTVEESPFKTLPNILIQHIFSFFLPESLCQISLVSKNWNIQSSQNRVWEPLVKKVFPESYKMSVNSEVLNQNITFWKNLFRKCASANKNIALNKFKEVSIPDEKKSMEKWEGFLAITKIYSNSLVKVLEITKSSNLIIENLNTRKIEREFALYEDSKEARIFDLKIEKEILYASASHTLWIIDQNDTLYPIELEKTRTWQIDEFKSFVLDKTSLYIRAYHGGQEVVYVYDLQTKSKTALIYISSEFIDNKIFEFYQETLFLSISDNTIVSFNKKTGKKTEEFYTGIGSAIDKIKIYDEKLFAYVNFSNKKKNHSIFVWDLNPEKKPKPRSKSFSCIGKLIDMQFFDHQIFCGFSSSWISEENFHTILVFDIEPLTKLASFEAKEELSSFYFANGILTTVTEIFANKQSHITIDKKDFNL